MLCGVTLAQIAIVRRPNPAPAVRALATEAP
jgi:hypothetical protein